MAKITVTANYKTNKLTVEVDGVAGSSCQNITEQFENAMGMIASTEKKREFYEVNTQQAYQ